MRRPRHSLPSSLIRYVPRRRRSSKPCGALLPPLRRGRGGRAGIWLGRSRSASAQGRAGPAGRPWPCHAAIPSGCARPACQRCAAGRPCAEYAYPQPRCARPRANHVCTHAPLSNRPLGGIRRKRPWGGPACLTRPAGCRPRLQSALPSATALRCHGAGQLLCQNAVSDRAAGDKPSHGRLASRGNCTRMRGYRFGVHAHPGAGSEGSRVFGTTRATAPVGFEALARSSRAAARRPLRLASGTSSQTASRCGRVVLHIQA